MIRHILSIYMLTNRTHSWIGEVCVWRTTWPFDGSFMTLREINANFMLSTPASMDYTTHLETLKELSEISCERTFIIAASILFLQLVFSKLCSFKAYTFIVYFSPFSLVYPVWQCTAHLIQILFSFYPISGFSSWIFQIR